MLKKIIKNKDYLDEQVVKVAEATMSSVEKTAKVTLDEVEKMTDVTSREFDRVANPIRQGAFKRFPSLFLLAVTFGFTAMVTGMEQILLQSHLLQSHPWRIFFVGVLTLIVTGRFYKKLE